MLKVDYTVKVYVGGSVDIASIGLASGVCTWDGSLGILDDKWWGNLSSSVDISYSGNYEVHSPTSIKIIRVALVETTLKNNGLSLVGSRVDIEETTTYGTRILKRGVIDGLPVSGNTIEVMASHVTNKYNANLTSRFGDEYGYLVYGEGVNRIPLSLDVSDVEADSYLIKEQYYPAFVVYRNYNNGIQLRSVYTTDKVSESEMLDYITSSQYYLLEASNALVCSAIDFVRTITVDSKEYTTFTMYVLPLNRRDDSRDWYIEEGDTVYMKFTDYSKVYTPQGVSPNPDNVKYEKDGVLYNFPSYIDSIKYYSDRIEVLDSDDSGISLIQPSFTRLTNELEMSSIYSTTDNHDGFGVTYGDVENDSSSEVNSVVNLDKIAMRDDSTPFSIKGTYRARWNEQASFANVTPYFSVAYGVGAPEKYDTMMVTADLFLQDYTDSYQLENVRVQVHIETVLGYNGVFVDTIGVNSGVITPYSIQEYRLPASVENDTDNVNFRVENGSLLGTISEEINIKELYSFQEVELKNPITIFYSVSFPVDFQYTTLTDRMHEVSINLNVYSEDSYSLDNLYVDNASNVDNINDVPNAYIDVCSKQNLSSLGFATPSSGWGLEIPTGDITEAVNTTDILANATDVDLIYKSNKTSTKSTKYELLKYGFGIGFIDSEGLENWSDIATMYDAGGVVVASYNVIGKPTVRTFDSNRVFCDIGVKTVSGNIDVRNTEQSVYDSDYVDGTVTENDKKLLWLSGSLLYNRWGVKNEYPTKLADCTNIVEPINYIKSQYLLAGAVGSIVDGSATVALYDRYTLSFTVSSEFAIEKGLWIGDSIAFTFPYIATGHSGIITGTTRDINNETVTITAEMVGSQIASSEEYTIIESGSQVDNIVESGDRDTNYVEVV